MEDRIPFRAPCLTPGPSPRVPQFMNPDYMGKHPGRCSDVGYSQNELKFSAYVKQANPFKEDKAKDPVVQLS